MAKLIYTAITSLDGYIEDEEGRFDWAEPDGEVHAFVNDLERPVGTHVYGRRMYETRLSGKRSATSPGCQPPRRTSPRCGEPWTRWCTPARSTPSRRPAPGSSASSTPRSSAGMKEADRDISVSGPGLAQHAFRAGLVDEVHPLVFPIVVGAGKPGLPRDVRVELELLDERRFGNGVVHMHYRTR